MIKAVLQGLALGLVVGFVTLAIQEKRRPSPMKLFAHTALGEEEGAVRERFYREARIYCGVYSISPDRRDCILQDEWRDFYLEFGSDGRLRAKFYLLHPQRSLLGLYFGSFKELE